MMTDHLARSHEAGTAISALHASEAAIYGRYGYGLAVVTHQVTVGRGTTFTAPHLEDEVAGITTHLVTMSDAGVAERMRACQLANAPDFPGTIVGTPDFFSLLTLETPETLRDKERRRVLFARRDGRDVGFIGLRREHKWDNARPSGTVTVGTFCGGPAARLALARRIVDLDLMGTTKLENVGVDDPLLDWVGGPRGTGSLETWDSTWVRLVDLGAAWPLRRYDVDCDVVVEVEDRHAPWNAGRWRLTGSEAQRTDAEAEVTLDVAVLGAGYLGHSIGGLLRAGLVREHRAGAYAELARAMRTVVEPEPSIGF